MLRCSLVVASVLALAAGLAQSASAASPVALCVPGEGGRAITTPSAGTCGPGATLRSLAPQGELSDVKAQLATTRSELGSVRAALAAARGDVERLRGDLASTTSELDGVHVRIDRLQGKLAGVTRGTVGGRPTLTLTGLNLRLVDGTGDTGGTPNGLGNLIVGYNESPRAQTGSHNIILGLDQRFTSWGAIVGGAHNTSDGPSQAVLGNANIAIGDYAAALGGTRNEARTALSAILGGCANVTGPQPPLAPQADDPCLVGSGLPVGYLGLGQTVSGGAFNGAGGTFASITGGRDNHTDNEYPTVTGGLSNLARATNAVVVGGSANRAGYVADVVVGGSNNDATAGNAVVVGGDHNRVGSTAQFPRGGGGSVVLGGQGNALGATLVTLPATP